MAGSSREALRLRLLAAGLRLGFERVVGAAREAALLPAVDLPGHADALVRLRVDGHQHAERERVLALHAPALRVLRALLQVLVDEVHALDDGLLPVGEDAEDLRLLPGV